MNANELNKWIENSPYTEQEEVIVLLRQQQAEIEALKHWQDTWRPFLQEHFGLKK